MVLSLISLNSLLTVHRFGVIEVLFGKLVFFIEEEMCDQSLLDVVLQYKYKGEELPIRLKLTAMINVLDAVNYLHRSKIVHGNIKLSNILGSEKRFKLCDAM